MKNRPELSKASSATCQGSCHDCALITSGIPGAAGPSWRVVFTALKIFMLPLGAAFSATLFFRNQPVLQMVGVLIGFAAGAHFSRKGGEARWV